MKNTVVFMAAAIIMTVLGEINNPSDIASKIVFVSILMIMTLATAMKKNKMFAYAGVGGVAGSITGALGFGRLIVSAASASLTTAVPYVHGLALRFFL